MLLVEKEEDNDVGIAVTDDGGGLVTARVLLLLLLPNIEDECCCFLPMIGMTMIMNVRR